jgi:phospholipase/carboxylesterase
MKYTQTDSQAMVVLTPSQPPMASVIWLHGLGADGHDFVPIVPELRLPASLAARFIFPHAPRRPVTLNNGYVMRAWYDIIQLGGNSAEDAAGIRASAQEIGKLVDAEHASGVPFNKIVIAGFSQGGAMALQTALRYSQRLAGVMPLSCYLPLRESLTAEAAEANRDLPILMCHGRQDPVVPLSMGQRSRDLLRSQGYAVDFREYDMPHSVCAPEIVDMSLWLQKVLA